MENSHYPLAQSQIEAFQQQGYLVIPGFLNSVESNHLQQWAQEIHDLPRTADAPYLPYEVSERSNPNPDSH